jgi:His-Xaa-Ser system protein HxsD
MSIEPQFLPFIDKGTLSIKFDSSIHTMSSIKKACYKFINQFGVKFNETGSGLIEVTFTSISPIDDKALKEISCEIQNEVLDQDLREEISKETENIRNLILAQAFSNTSLIQY